MQDTTQTHLWVHSCLQYSRPNMRFCYLTVPKWRWLYLVISPRSARFRILHFYIITQTGFQHFMQPGKKRRCFEYFDVASFVFLAEKRVIGVLACRTSNITCHIKAFYTKTTLFGIPSLIPEVEMQSAGLKCRQPKLSNSDQSYL